MSDLGFLGSPHALAQEIVDRSGSGYLNHLKLCQRGADVKGPPCSHVCLLPFTSVTGKGHVVIHHSLQ